MTDTTTATTSEDKVVTKRINKTNVNFAIHHYGQAILSLQRAQTMTKDLGSRNGRLSSAINSVWLSGQEVLGDLDTAIADLQDVLGELEAVFG